MRIVILIVTIFFIVVRVHAQEVKIVTEDLPPYQVIKNKKVGGFATEIVEAVFKEAGASPKIRVYPWVRAYKMALEQENVLIYSIVRSKQREPLFKWLGELDEVRYYFFGLQSRRDIQIQSIEQAKQYKTGVTEESVEYQELHKRGFSRLKIVTRQTQLVEMLYKKRFDLLFGSELPVAVMVENSNRDYSQLKKFYEIKEMRLKLYMAFSQKTSDALVSKYRKAYESVKNKNIYSTIKDKWFGKR
ncbi:substrate-binding periplasmic protein [Zooshikella sp. RANM57]|uniref:substrate-binding periplasmic protein n=1 Tax=Zooshikella sp. RANM57 TaxID=3425863 RepID=UPI003D6E7843